MRCERIALPTEPYPHGRFTNSIIINTQKKCKHNYINRFTNFNCYGKIFFTWRHGSAGRAFASHARGHRFESCCLHQQKTHTNLVVRFLLVETTKGQELENLFSAFGGCLQPLALCTVCIVADTLCRCVVYFYSSLCRAAPVVFCFTNNIIFFIAKTGKRVYNNNNKVVGGKYNERS